MTTSREVDRTVAELQAENARLTAELASERDRFRVAFEHAPAGVSVVSLVQVRYVYVNPALARFFGYSADEMLRADPYRFLMDVTHPEDFPRDRAEFQRLVDGDIDSYRLTKRFIQRSGDVRWALVAISAVRAPDRTLDYVVSHLIDIHEQKLQEQSSRESRRPPASRAKARGARHARGRHRARLQQQPARDHGLHCVTREGHCCRRHAS
jgi:PAS domain S-box-containing protein